MDWAAVVQSAMTPTETAIMSKPKKVTKRIREGAIFLTLPPDVAHYVRLMADKYDRPVSRQILTWIKPHLPKELQ